MPMAMTEIPRWMIVIGKSLRLDHGIHLGKGAPSLAGAESARSANSFDIADKTA